MDDEERAVSSPGNRLNIDQCGTFGHSEIDAASGATETEEENAASVSARGELL